MTGNSVDAANQVGKPQMVQAKEAPVVETGGTLTVAPISVNIYRLPLKTR